MPVLKKTLFPENLEKYTTLIQDTDPNSKYFKITELSDTFTAGKNSFLIQASDYLVPDTLIKIEIKDSQGKVIYHEPGGGIISSSINGENYTNEYYEGNSKVVSVHIYPDTTYGPCTITILGELKEYDNNGVRTPIPVNWIGQYNVRWQKKINVNPQLNNTTKIRFYRRPKIQITESILPIYVYSSGSNTIATGIVSGSNEFAGTNPLLWHPSANFQFSTKLTPSGSSFSFTPDMSGSIAEIIVEYPSASVPIGERITGQNWVPVRMTGSLGPDYYTGYPLVITGVTSSTEAYVRGIFAVTNSAWPIYPILEGSFERGQISVAYTQSAGYISSGVDSSFANIKLTDLETFTGDAVRLKIYGRSRNDLGDYTLLEDITLESDELLEVPTHLGQLNARTGIFTPSIINTFWKNQNLQTGVSVDFDSNGSYAVLIPTTDSNSSTGLFKFYTSQSINFTKNTEYALDYTPILSSSVANYGKLEVYISGSAANTVGKPNNYGQLIHTIETNENYRKFGKQQLNFKPENNGSGSLVFIPKSGKWKLADISLRAAQESAFSPNEFSINLNLPVKIQNEIFDFKFEIYDINNNYVPVKLEASQSFIGGSDLKIKKDLKVNLASTIFNFSRVSSSYFPKEIIIDVEKTALTGSLQFYSTSVDITGGVITATPSPGLLTTITPEKKYKLTINNFTGSLSNVTASAIVYTASCEGIERYFTIYKVSDGADGPTGPGILMRGIWTSSLDYFGADTQNSRRDAVIYPDPSTNGGVTQFFVAKTKTGPTSVPGPQAPNGAPADNSYWQYLGNQQMFVAAKIGLFEESYVQNTLNIGTNNNGSQATANITLYGGNQFPYMSIGQSVAGTYASGGIFLGNDSGSYRMSLVGTAGSLLWNGSALTISGSVSAIDGNIGGWIISQSALTNTNSRLRLNPITPGMEIYDSESVKRLDVRFGQLTTIGTTTVSENTPSLTIPGTTFGNNLYEDTPVKVISPSTSAAILVTDPGTYRGTISITTPTGNAIVTDSNFSGYFLLIRGIQVEDSTGNIIAERDVQVISAGSPSTTYNWSSVTTGLDITFPAAGNYYLRTYWIRDYTINTVYPPPNFIPTRGTATLGNGSAKTWNATAVSLNLENNLCEFTNEGLQILSSDVKYVKFPRTTGNIVSEIKGKATFEGNSAGSTDFAVEVRSYNDAGGTGAAGADGLYIWARDQALYVATGSVWKQGTNTWNVISDERLKTNITEFTGALDILNKLSPKKYQFINQNRDEYEQGEQIGFIAQDIESFYPKWVSQGKLESGSVDSDLIKSEIVTTTDGSGSYEIRKVKGLSFGTDMTAILVASIQELNKKIEFLETKLSGSL